MNEPMNPTAENGPVQPEQAQHVAIDGSDLDQLRRRVQELEAANAQCRAELAAVQAERDHWRTEAFHWVEKEFVRDGALDEEKWKRMIAEEKWYPMEDLVEELKQLAEKS